MNCPRTEKSKSVISYDINFFMDSAGGHLPKKAANKEKDGLL